MADEKVFKIAIDGLEQSYTDTVKLANALKLLEDKTIKVTAEIDKASKAINNSTKASKEKVKALSEEEKAQKKLTETQEKAQKPITEMEKAQELANQQLEERTKLLKQQVTEENAVANSMAQMKAQLEVLNNEWNNVDIDSDRFRELAEEIDNLTTKLKEVEVAEGSFRKLGSGIDKVAEGTKGLVSCLQAGVSVALMFDEGNEKLAKTMNSLNKIMAIVGAIQQVNNVILKNGTLIQIAYSLQNKARIALDALVTKGIITQTTAQIALNIATKAFPLLAIIGGIAALVGLLASFSGSTEDATEKQKKLNDTVNDSIQLKDQYASKLKAISDANINQLQRDLDLLKARGASEDQIEQKQRQIYEERLKNAQNMAIYYSDEVDAIDKNSKAVDKYTRHLGEMNKRINQAIKDGKERLKYNFEGVTYDVKLDEKSIEKEKNKLQTSLDTVTIKLKQGLDAEEGRKEAENDLDKFEAGLSQKKEERRKKGVEQGKKNALALAEYEVLMAQKGSKEELKARIAAANQKLKNDLSNTDITNGERLKRTKETLIEIEKLEAGYRKFHYQEDIALADAQLLTVKKGSLEEYNLLVGRLENRKKIDLDNKELTSNQKLLIENKYQADLKKLTDDYAKTEFENEINTSISSINARLSSAKEGSEEEYQLREELARETARLAKEEVETTIEDGKLKAAKLLEIEEKLQKDIREMSMDKEVSNVSNQAKEETLALTQELEARTITKKEYEDRMLAISRNALEKEIEIRKKYGQDTSEQETSLSNMRIAQAEREKNKVKEHFEEMYANLQKIVDNITTGVTAIFDAANSVMQAQLDDAKEKYDAISEKYDEAVQKREESDSRIQDLEEKAKNARGGRALILQEQINKEIVANQALADQEKQLAKEKEKQEKEVAKKEKQQKKMELTQNIIQGIANTALGATKAWSLGPIVGPVLAAVVAAAGAVQVGVMKSQLSKLEDGGLLKGKRHSNGGMRVEGTNIEVEGGEYVVNRQSTAKNIGLIRYINSERRELKPSDINSFFARSSQDFDSPFKRMFETGGQLPAINTTVNADNEVLIDAIRSMKIEPKVSVTDINNSQDGVVKIDNWTGL